MFAGMYLDFSFIFFCVRGQRQIEVADGRIDEENNNVRKRKKCKPQHLIFFSSMLHIFRAINRKSASYAFYNELENIFSALLVARCLIIFQSHCKKQL